MSTATELQPDLYRYGLVDEVQVRAINEESRSATFVAATENGVDTWMGKEFLRMTGARLQRYRRNPVVLDAHDRFESGAVIGRADVKIEDKKLLIAEVTFAKTTRANEIWELVRTGFLRALSVGFVPDNSKITRLSEGEVDGEGDDAIKGPARIIRQWELFEISVVPVPADAEALKRSFFEKQNFKSTLGNEERETNMTDPNPKPAPPAPNPQPAPQPEPVPPTEEMRALQTQKLRAETIRSIAPAACKELAETLVLEGVSVDEASKRFLAELKTRTAPVGTGEPAPITGEGAPKNEKPNLEKMSNQEFKRMLVG